MRVAGPEGIYRVVFWRRVAVAALAGALVLWIATAAAVWAWARYQRNIADARFTDVLLYPWRASEYRAAIGRHYIALARVELEQKNEQRGLELLAAGVALAPTDVPGRRLLAFHQLRVGRPELAVRTLAAGAMLEVADLAYLKLVFGLLLELHEDDELVALAARLLPATPSTKEEHRFVALQAATAHYERGRYNEARRLIEQWQLGDEAPAQLLLARCEWEAGSPELAVRRLEAQLERFQDNEEIYAVLVRWLRASGNDNAAQQHAQRRRVNQPLEPAPRIDLLSLYHAAGDHAAFERELGDYRRTFRSDKALLLLARLGVDLRAPQLTSEAYRVAQENGAAMQPFAFARIEAALAARDYKGAVEFGRDAVAHIVADDDRAAAQLAGLRAAALFGAGDRDAGRRLLQKLTASALRGSDVVLVAKHLADVGQVREARAFLAQACARDPRNELALAELVRLDIEALDRTALLESAPKLLRSRKPERALLEKAARGLNRREDVALRQQIMVRVQTLPSSAAPE